ncbi:MAG: hypothetical protein WED07_02510 [Candidatus Freyarchaeum deiterrae]
MAFSHVGLTNEKSSFPFETAIKSKLFQKYEEEKAGKKCIFKEGVGLQQRNKQVTLPEK